MIRNLTHRLLKRLKRWDRTQPFTKRQQFVVITILLTVLLMFTQLVPLDFRYPMVGVIFMASFLLTALGLRDDLSRVEWATLLILPSFFTAAVALFYFLLPTRWVTRLPIAALYAVGMYALLLTENIYNVAAARTIALLRAAHSVGFLLTLVTYFLLIQTVLAYRFSGWAITLLVGMMTYPLTLQIIWAITLEPTVAKRVKDITMMITLVLSELAWIFSFWPVRTTLLALFLTTCFYGMVGMGQQYLADRLYKRTVWEFFSVVAIVFTIVMVTVDWRVAL
ncbi:MAG TPA: hypothetical protein VJB96_04265 [Patescibacteria group bacterium]|nr:hypothetical protein [Patescibacteria group bacterium]